jgi:hypothetical protein
MSSLGIIWGADGIARAINRSPDYVRRTLAKMPGSPVHRAGRSYWSNADDLRSFFDHLAEKKPVKPTSSQLRP